MVGVIFFYGTSIPAVMVRIRTQRPGQSFGDVPSHVGIVAGLRPEYFEAIVSGVHASYTLPSPSVRPIPVAVPDETALVAYLRNQVGEPYDWGAILDDTVGRTLPWDILMRRKRAHDCSGLVTDALLIGGVKIAHLALPETPNDLLYALQEVAGVFTHQGECVPERHTMNFLQGIFSWLRNRVLKLPAKDDKAIAKALGTTPDKVAAANDAVAGIVTAEAGQAVDKVLPGA